MQLETMLPLIEWQKAETDDNDDDGEGHGPWQDLEWTFDCRRFGHLLGSVIAYLFHGLGQG